MSGQGETLDCPYVGLTPFEAEHADYFFGRTLDSEILADNVLALPIVVFYGASAVGKSSVLNVGLPKALRHLGASAHIVSRREWHQAGLLGTWLDDVTATALASPSQRLIVVIDQFEEYFLYSDAEQVQTFTKALATLVERTDVEVHLLIALRDDSLHRLDALRDHLPGILDTTLELRHLDEGAVREAITEPITVWNKRHVPKVALDGNFADTLIAELRPKDPNGRPVKGGRVELAYLQLALERIWDAEGGEKATALRTSTLTNRLKGISEISRQHVEDVLGKLPEVDKAICATVFDRLVTPSGGKILYATSDLAAIAKVDERRMDEVLAPLARGKTRLLRSGSIELPGGKHEDGYEILHDILARPILAWTADRAARREQQQKITLMTREAEQQKLKAENAALRNRKRFLSALVVLLPLLVVAAGWAGWQMNVARKEAEDARVARERAEAEAKRSAQLLERLTNSERAKRAFLAGDIATIRRFASNANTSDVVFGARRDALGWKTSDGKPVYRYELYPLPESVTGPLRTASQVSYYMNHPTFRQKLLTAGPTNGFVASYTGWGCLTAVYVLIEYDDPERPPDVTWYDCVTYLNRAGAQPEE